MSRIYLKQFQIGLGYGNVMDYIFLTLRKDYIKYSWAIWTTGVHLPSGICVHDPK